MKGGLKMNNRLFNVNGKGKEMLLATLKLAFEQKGFSNTTAKSWIETEEHGLILCWCKDDKFNPLPSELTAEQCLPMVEQWLQGDFAKTVKLSKWCENIDHDGDNSLGWQVYVENWGHVGKAKSYAICGIKPAYMWHGK